MGDVDELIDRFLAERAPRTAQAYVADLEDFGRWQGRPPAKAVAVLLAAGEDGARQMVLSFAARLKRDGRARSTIGRRIGTLRLLVRLASDDGMVDWRLDLGDWPLMMESADEPADAAPYVLPRHPSEVDRLDLQHYALAEALGTPETAIHYLAPVGDLRRALDVGAGTGQWGYDVCRLHGGAMVMGLDLIEPKPGQPAGYRAVRGNVLQGLPFRSDSFDLVHQRLLFTGVPVANWPETVVELVRVCRPGGWVELVEGATESAPMGAAMGRLVELLLELNRAAGLDTASVVFRSLDRYLVNAGLEEVARRTVELPVGEWAGRIGSLIASDIRALFTRLGPVFAARLGAPAAECVELVRTAQLEWEELHTKYSIAVVWGRKREGEDVG